MFVALRSEDLARVTSIDPEWDDAEAVLREATSRAELVCPGCLQPLWLKTGPRRRRHFAHRSRADCPLDDQSTQVMEVKALLYTWLQTKCPGKVHLDMTIGVPGLDRHLDLVVEPEPGRKFAYWVFDRQQRDRDYLDCYRTLKNISVHFLHTASTLRPQAPDHVVLSASQRHFIQHSDFDANHGRGHLHFLHADPPALSIYRGLHCVHTPNVYDYATRRTGPLNSALISPKAGEIVFPEDVAARKEWRNRQRATPQPHPRPESVAKSSEPASEFQAAPAAQIEEPVPNINGPFRCTVCGTMTTQWSQATPGAGTCRCRRCPTEKSALP